MKKVLLIVALALGSPLWGAVANDGSGTNFVQFSSGTSANLTTFTVGSGTNRCLVAALDLRASITSPNLTWNGTAMTQALAYDDTFGEPLQIWVLINPATGNNTLAASWTGSAAGVLAAIEFSGADQSTCFKVADNQTNTGVSNPIGVTVTSATNDATLATANSVFCGISIVNQTTWYSAGFPPAEGSGSYALGGSSNTHNFNCGNHNAVAGIHILAASGGAAAKQCNFLTLGVGQC